VFFFTKSAANNGTVSWTRCYGRKKESATRVSAPSAARFSPTRSRRSTDSQATRSIAHAYAVRITPALQAVSPVYKNTYGDSRRAISVSKTERSQLHRPRRSIRLQTCGILTPSLQSQGGAPARVAMPNRASGEWAFGECAGLQNLHPTTQSPPHSSRHSWKRELVPHPRCVPSQVARGAPNVPRLRTAAGS